MTRQAHWKRQHRRHVVLASLALGALISAAPAFALADEQVDAVLPVIDCFEYQADNNYDAAPLPSFDEMQVVIVGEANAPSSGGDVPGSADSTHNGVANSADGNDTGQNGASGSANADTSNAGQTETSNGTDACQNNAGQTGASNDTSISQGNAGLDGTSCSADANNSDAGQNTISGSSNEKQDNTTNGVNAGQNTEQGDASGAGSRNSNTTHGNATDNANAGQGNGAQGDAANGADENQGGTSSSDGANQDGVTGAGQGGNPDDAGGKADGQENTGGSTDGSTSDTDKPGTGTDASQGGTTDKGDGSQPGAPEPDKPGSGSSTQEPAVLTGWQNIGGYRYYYDSDGKPLTGLQTIEDKTYLFNDKGRLGYGFLYLGDNVVSYFDPITGSQLTGKQFIHGSWRNIDEQTGLNCGLTEVSESGKTNTYYYDNYDGGLHTGQQYVNNSWHFFDEDTGRMYTRDEEVRRIVQFTLAELGGSESTAFGYLDEVKADGGTYCGYGPCMATVRHIFKAAGMSGFLADGFVDSWPHKYLDLMIEKGQHTMTPRVGMVAFFLWENSFANQIGVSADHAEIIVEVGDGWYKTVGAIAGGIKESIYYTASDYNIGFGVPAFYR